MTLNPQTTLVSVHCYSGDQDQVIDAMPAYLHHECPVVIVSPEDSPATFYHPSVKHLLAGKVGYIGQVSLDRQLAQMKALLAAPGITHFLLNDSDSVVLDAQIPQYLYDEDVVWSNQVDDAIPEHQGSFPSDWPHVAFQPPYFMSRNIMEKLVAAGESGHPFTVASPMMPFIDFYMVQLTMIAGVPWKRMRDCISCPISISKSKTPEPHHIETVAMGFKIAANAVRNGGASIIHSVKDGETIAKLVEMRKEFLAEHPDHLPRDTRPPRIR